MFVDRRERGGPSRRDLRRCESVPSDASSSTSRRATAARRYFFPTADAERSIALFSRTRESLDGPARRQGRRKFSTVPHGASSERDSHNSHPITDTLDLDFTLIRAQIFDLPRRDTSRGRYDRVYGNLPPDVRGFFQIDGRRDSSALTYISTRYANNDNNYDGCFNIRAP